MPAYKYLVISQHPLHYKQCPKHHVYYIWKHDLPWYKVWEVKHYTPLRVCPMCVKLAKLELNYYSEGTHYVISYVARIKAKVQFRIKGKFACTPLAAPSNKRISGLPRGSQRGPMRRAKP